MNHTIHRFNWTDGHTKERRLTRSFNTLEEARRFSEGKRDTDIFKNRGRYTVEWVKVEENKD